ncbi:hypothetical protein N627_2494 [Levilactobacillus brevis]|nr:hypothetical protein N627_2494 [Levilactobacillus brevis]
MAKRVASLTGLATRFKFMHYLLSFFSLAAAYGYDVAYAPA